MKFEYHPDRDNGQINKIKARNLVYHAKRFLPGARNFLDLGCGKGTLVEYGIENGLNIYGLDLRPEIYIADKSRYVKGDVIDIPFRDGTFDVVIERLLLADIQEIQKRPEEEINSVIREMHRVLKPNGVFVPYPASTIHRKDSIKDIFEEVYYDGFGVWGVYRKIHS